FNLAAGEISIKGPLGAIARRADPNVEVKKDGENLVFKALGNSNHADAMSGTMRALVANMVQGVTKGFEKRLALVGVGFRAQAQGDKLNLTLGYSHPVVHQMPKGIKVVTPTQTEIVITGIDKQLVGQVAADVRGQLKHGANRKAAELVGSRIAAKAKEKGIEKVAFDRAGYRYHGRVKALADAARAGGLKF